MASASHIRIDIEGRVYYRQKLPAGRTKMEAMRCLKRRISDAIYRQVVAVPVQLVRASEGTAGRL